MLLATLREPPKRGSLREFVLSLVLLKKQQIEHARLRALAQLLLDKEKGPEVFEQYMKTAFPWIETVKRREVDDARKVLMQEIQKGPLQITPTVDVSLRSRSVKKVQLSEDLRKKDWVPKINRILEKVGPMIPKG